MDFIEELGNFRDVADEICRVESYSIFLHFSGEEADISKPEQHTPKQSKRIIRSTTEEHIYCLVDAPNHCANAA